MLRSLAALPLVAVLAALGGCGKQPAALPPPPTPKVDVAYPIARDIVDYELFTGRTEPSNKIDLRARVTGYLEQTFFVEGTVVEKDALLFRIDQRPYKVELERGKAAVVAATATAALAEGLEARGKGLLAERAISREDYDKLVADVRIGKANVLVAQAALAQAELNMTWTEMRAPFKGRIGRWTVDPGNLVKADDTILSTLVAVEPMFVLFDVDERTVLQQMIKNGLTKMPPPAPVQVTVGLVDEPGQYPHPAVMNFVDNRLDSSTGSLWFRAEFVKPDRAIAPGMFARVKFPLGPSHKAICVAEEALATDQGQRFVYKVVEKPLKVDGKDTLVPVAEYVKVTVGRQHGGLRIVTSGLTAGDRIVVSGLQRVRSGSAVQPNLKPMPGTDIATPPDEPGGPGTATPKQPAPPARKD